MSAPAITTRTIGRIRGLRVGLRGGDLAAYLVTLAFAVAVLGVTVFLVWELWIHSIPSRAKFGFGFLTGTDWDPVAGNSAPCLSSTERW